MSTSFMPTPSIVMARALPQSVSEVASMSPLDLFQSQLDTQTEGKVDAMKRLSVVAHAIGKKETLNKLIPYLTHQIANKQPPHEDELLLQLAQQLKLLVPSLLTKSTQCLPLLPILERLMAIEETVVRDAAVVTANHVFCELTDSSSAPIEAVHLVKRLAASDWFTGRVSAAGILPNVMSISKEKELRVLMRDLCADDAPMVRRAAAKNVGRFLALLSQDTSALNELTPAWKSLCSDEQDSVRLLAVASLKDMDTFQDNTEWTSSTLLPLVKAGSTDPSWRVRHNLSKCFSQVATNLGSSLSSPHKKLTMACFVALLQDVEPEVRAAAVGHFATMVQYGGEALFHSHLAPLLPGLADDVVMEVRSKTALALMDAVEVGTLQDSTILTSFGPLLETFLQDEYPEVQLHVLQNLGRISHLLHQLTGVVTSILHMSKATNWRVRQGVAQLLPHLAEARGMEFFTSVLLEPAWLALLLDAVASVRQACVEGTRQLATVAKADWMLQQLLPHHVRIYQSSGYLLRMTILQTYVQMALSEEDALVQEATNQVLQGLQEDKVANVRIVAAKGLHELIVQQSQLDKARIKAALEQALRGETDDDVTFFCQLALEAC